jgi:cell division protein ZapA
VNETTKSDTHRKPVKTSNATSGAKTFEVEIAGVPLRLKSSHDEQTVKELVRLVDEKIREALPLTKTGSIQNASILASLNLAEEYLMLKRKALSELDGLEAKAMKVITEMENTRSQVAPKTALDN